MTTNEAAPRTAAGRALLAYLREQANASDHQAPQAKSAYRSAARSVEVALEKIEAEAAAPAAQLGRRVAALEELVGAVDDMLDTFDAATEQYVHKGWPVTKRLRKARALLAPTPVGACIFEGCVSRERHWHAGFPGGYTNPADPEGPPIPFTAEPAPGVRDYNGAILSGPAAPAASEQTAEETSHDS